MPPNTSTTFILSTMKKWISLPKGVNRISFSNLKPGTYNFKIRAKDNTVYSNIKRNYHLYISCMVCFMVGQSYLLLIITDHYIYHYSSDQTSVQNASGNAATISIPNKSMKQNCSSLSTSLTRYALRCL